MDHGKTTNAASRTNCPALTPTNVPNFCIPIFAGRKTFGVHPGSSLRHNIKPHKSLSVYDAQMRGPHHFVSSVHIDSHFESELIDSNNYMKYEIWSESDPGMKLSMTYDHIPKVKTPYGFYFLQHSPTSIKRETLLRSTRYRDHKMHQSSYFDHFDHCKKEECSQAPANCDSCVSLTSDLATESSEYVSKARCKTDVLVSPAKDSNSIQVSTSLTYESPAKRCSITMSTSINCPEMSSDTLMKSVSRTPKLMSIYKDRLDAINKLHMLCVRQLFAAGSRDLGEIELALQYDQRRRRLRVRVLQASGVGLSSNNMRNSNTHVRLCLIPDKQNPQHTTVVKGTCDPIYNEDFYFNVSPCELNSSGLKVRVFQSSGLLLDKWTASCVGEMWLNLADLKGTSEVVFVREDLKPKADKGNTSMLNVSICYRSRIRKLCITVVRAQKLSKSGFLKTAPDCRVKVEVTQVKNNALSTVIKRTGVRRHTRNPVFKESMSFEIDDLNNLRDGMTVVCTLSSKSLMGKPQTLGQVRLGLGSSRTSEKQQWTNVLQNPGHSITQWHTL